MGFKNWFTRKNNNPEGLSKAAMAARYNKSGYSNSLTANAGKVRSGQTRLANTFTPRNNGFASNNVKRHQQQVYKQFEKDLLNLDKDTETKETLISLVKSILDGIKMVSNKGPRNVQYGGGVVDVYENSLIVKFPITLLKPVEVMFNILLYVLLALGFLAGQILKVAAIIALGEMAVGGI
jgi:hypothetical protein